jgi:cell division protein FtsB
MDDTDNSRVIDPLRQRIAIFETKNGKIRAENVELKARIAKLEDKQIQNELIKNLLSVLQKLLS